MQGWLDSITQKGLSRNSLKRIKSCITGIFARAKQQGYFDGANPADDTAVSPRAAEPQETYAYDLTEITPILTHAPEPATTAFAIAAMTGLRIGEIEGLNWEDYRDGEIHVTRSIWNGHETDPKTGKSKAPVPAIRQLAQRLDVHRLRCSDPKSGPMFATTKGTRMSMNNLLKRVLLPALNAGGIEWHGWHAACRGLGSNLYRLGVPDVIIQRIPRHSNVSTTTAYYIKTASPDVRIAMDKLESNFAESGTIGRLEPISPRAM